MKEKNNIFLATIVTLLLIMLMFVIEYDKRLQGEPIEAYQVYLNGEKIGVIASKDELLKLIDTEQANIKEKYSVDQVYPPEGLEIEKIYTYASEIYDSKYIYERIKDIEPFTIRGYTVTINYPEGTQVGESERIFRDAKKIYMLDKEFIREALRNTATAFLGASDLEAYEKDTQIHIETTGEEITNVYFQEVITIKEDLISTEELIFTNVEDLSKYLLYSTLDQNKFHVSQLGENLYSIADKNSLNIQELLIANPQYKSADVLLTAGENINVDLINPLVSLVYRKNVVSDIEVEYKKVYQEDKTKYYGNNEVLTKGQNGITRVTQDVMYINGEISSLNITKRETIKETVDEVISQGTLVPGGGTIKIDLGEGEYTWPTGSPSIITSPFAYRWGTLHKGIDISGTGCGSPVYAIKEGIVTAAGFNSSEGYYVDIRHELNGRVIYSQYMHMATQPIVVSGQIVARGEKLGLMGNTGYSFGCHLHLGIWLDGPPYTGGTVVDPCKSVFTC